MTPSELRETANIFGDYVAGDLLAQLVQYRKLVKQAAEIFLELADALEAADERFERMATWGCAVAADRDRLLRALATASLPPSLSLLQQRARLELLYPARLEHPIPPT